MKKVTLSAFCILTLAALSAVSGRAELVTDGNFSGGFTSWNTPNGTSGDPYWESTGPTGAQIGANFDGSGNPVTGYVSQVLTTTPGQEYTVTFLYGEYNQLASSSANNPATCAAQGGCYLDPGNVTVSHDPTVSPYAQFNSLSVFFNGTDALDLSNFFTSNPANIGPNNLDAGLTIGDYFYQEGSASFVATGASTTLEFDARDLQQAVVLTGVSVTATPEPSTFILFGGGIAVVAFFRMRSRKAAVQTV
jgi:hypothetical protein